eukprot:9876248-Alexandrium_andersonii.AAC.1
MSGMLHQRSARRFWRIASAYLDATRCVQAAGLCGVALDASLTVHSHRSESSGNFRSVFFGCGRYPPLVLDEAAGVCAYLAMIM